MAIAVTPSRHPFDAGHGTWEWITIVAVGDEVSVKVDAGGRVQSGNGGATAPELSADDITVAR